MVIKGRVRGIFIDRPGLKVSEAVEQAQATFAGFEGDRHTGLTMPANRHTGRYPLGTEIRNSRQLTMVSEEELMEVAGELDVPSILPEWLSANLALEGIPGLTHLPPYTRLVFPRGGALVIAAENSPCKTPGQVIQAQYPGRGLTPLAFINAARGKRGLVGWVERPGAIHDGDLVTVE